MDKLTVGLFNDSFPPTIDGVANAIYNYARVINEKHGNVVVATPYYPDVVDNYPFEVIRYPSANVSKKLGYRMGYPFSAAVISRLRELKIDVIHSHCPFASTVLARALRSFTGAPVILTYHTKFDYDIEKRTDSTALRKATARFMMANINACDEVWVVSEGAGENLRSMGYEGSYLVMENGADYKVGRSTPEDMERVREKHGLDHETPTFLYVGRMMWYKGIRLTLDSLKIAKEMGKSFRMIFVGEGVDRPEIMEYAKECGLMDCCIFTGAIYEREELKIYYSLADLFIFTSTYDTNGLVVREAASAYCPSLLIRNSCASEGVEHEVSGLIADEDADSIAREIIRACNDREWVAELGTGAATKVYISWEDAVEKAYSRYRTVVEDYRERTRAEVEDSVVMKRIMILRKGYMKGKLTAQDTYKRTSKRIRDIFQ